MRAKERHRIFLLRRRRSRIEPALIVSWSVRQLRVNLSNPDPLDLAHPDVIAAPVFRTLPFEPISPSLSAEAMGEGLASLSIVTALPCPFYDRPNGFLLRERSSNSRLFARKTL